MKLTLLPWLLLAIGTASATYSGHNTSSKASQHKSVATHAKHIRSEPTLYHRHCKTDDDCPGVSCCNLWTKRCTLDPQGTVCDLKPSTLHQSKKKSTTQKKSKTTSKSSSVKKSTSTTKHQTTATTSSKKSQSTQTTNSDQGTSDSNTTPSHQPDSLSAGNDGSSSTTNSQPTVNDPNNPVTNQPASETDPLATAPTGASNVSGSGTPAAASSSSAASTNNGDNSNSNSIANSNSVAGDVTNTKIGIGIGAGVGCVAAIGLAGLVLYRRREGRQQNNYDSGSGEPVSTRWRPQSFMAVLGGVVAKLPRSNSTSSRSSRLRSVFSNLSRNSSNRSNRSDGSGPSVGSAPSLARIDEHVSDGHNMRQY